MKIQNIKIINLITFIKFWRLTVLCGLLVVIQFYVTFFLEQYVLSCQVLCPTIIFLINLDYIISREKS